MNKYMNKSVTALLKCQQGFAATEFALILPVLATLFFGMLEISDAMTANRRVTLAVNTVADLAAQSPQLTPNQIAALIDGVIPILEPADTSSLVINVVSVEPDNNDDPVVHWSIDKAGALVYPVGEDYDKLSDNSVLDPSSSLIVVEIVYPFAPSFTQYFVSSPITFQRMSVRMPRLSAKVLLCNEAETVCS